MNELMTTLPLLVFLVILVNYMVGSFFIIYHLSKFGLDLKTKVLTIIFLAGLAILVFLNFYFFFRINWLDVFEFLNIL